MECRHSNWNAAADTVRVHFEKFLVELRQFDMMGPHQDYEPFFLSLFVFQCCMEDVPEGATHTLCLICFWIHLGRISKQDGSSGRIDLSGLVDETFRQCECVVLQGTIQGQRLKGSFWAENMDSLFPVACVSLGCQLKRKNTPIKSVSRLQDLSPVRMNKTYVSIENFTTKKHQFEIIDQQLRTLGLSLSETCSVTFRDLIDFSFKLLQLATDDLGIFYWMSLTVEITLGECDIWRRGGHGIAVRFAI
jgi:hypothetical protein